MSDWNLTFLLFSRTFIYFLFIVLTAFCSIVQWTKLLFFILLLGFFLKWKNLCPLFPQFLKGQFLDKSDLPQPKQGLILKEVSFFQPFGLFWTVRIWEMSHSSIFVVSALKFKIRWHSSTRFWSVIFRSCSNFVRYLDFISASFGAVRPWMKIKHLNISGVIFHILCWLY